MQINWQRVVLNLRREVSMRALAKRVKPAAAETLQKLATGEVSEPKFSLGMRLLDEHHKLCPERHILKEITLCQR